MAETKTRYKIPKLKPRNWGALTEPRIGVMLHYDESGGDDGAVEWLLFDPRCKVSYNLLVLHDGTVRDIAPIDKRAWHAGVCKPSDPRLMYKDANSALYGISVAAKHTEKATTAQFAMIVQICVALFKQHQWPASETWRIVSHRTEAWPRGRKDDPDGQLGVVLDVAAVREAVAKALQ
jgi:N-acetyl-anhydromuramyl-L-alanine amidase AmpD